jgi:ABC-type lipoprotein export system ATPase subunit
VPTVDLVRSSNVHVSARAKQLASMFELAPECTSERWRFSFELPEVWSIGVIVGASGSGKSTVAGELFKDALIDGFDWPANGTIIDGFDGVPIKDVASILSQVGFSSPPAWFRPFSALSTGQKFRATVARALSGSSQTIAIDEYTSVVDRTVAQIGSAAVAKAVRAAGKRFVAVTCHYDVIEWLQPDWVLEMPDGTFTRRSVQRRPAVHLEVYRTTAEAWGAFRQHHYLNHDLNKAAACYVATLDGRPVAFCSVLAFPHPVSPGWRTHRTVCLPDFQGVGIGNKLSELVASAYACTGKPVASTTTHPAMVRYRAKSPLWTMFRQPSRVVASNKAKSATTRSLNATLANNRYTASFRYVGPRNEQAAEAFGLESKW